MLGSMPQISRAYWAIVRSDENLPDAAMLSRDLRSHLSWFCHTIQTKPLQSADINIPSVWRRPSTWQRDEWHITFKIWISNLSITSMSVLPPLSMACSAAASWTQRTSTDLIDTANTLNTNTGHTEICSSLTLKHTMTLGLGSGLLWHKIILNYRRCTWTPQRQRGYHRHLDGLLWPWPLTSHIQN